MNAITAEALSKTYRSGLTGNRRVEALRSVSLEVAKGEIFSLLGPNGAGKTTFLKILLSITHQTAGAASILGARLPNTAVKEKIGYLPENHRLPGYLSGVENLRLFGRLSGVASRELEVRIPKLLELVGMQQWGAMKVKRYSKGMLQRVGLAQALINTPDVIFLDEPTDGVDPVGRKEIRDVLRRLRDEGKTIFLNSHLLSEVELISDRVAILDKGNLLRIGTVDELTAAGHDYLITVSSPPPDACMAEARALVMKLTPGPEGITANLESAAELNRLIDLLRKYEVEITGVTRRRTSLEESFLRLITKEAGS